MDATSTETGRRFKLASERRPPYLSRSMQTERTKPIRSELRLAVLALAIPALTGCANARLEPELAVINTISAHAEAWNRDDAAGFLDPYWRDDEATFVLDGRSYSGWSTFAQTLQTIWNERPPGSRLRYERIQIQQLGPDAMVATGQWVLTSNPSSSTGLFSWVLKKVAGRWLVAHQHVSAAPADADSVSPADGAAGRSADQDLRPATAPG